MSNEFEIKMQAQGVALSIEDFFDRVDTADLGFEVIYEDTGIGDFEFWGAKGFDSCPSVTLDGEGELVVVWAELGDVEIPKEHTEHRAVSVGDDEHDVEVEATISMALKDAPITEAKTLVLDDGTTLTYTLIQATYEWGVGGYVAL